MCGTKERLLLVVVYQSTYVICGYRGEEMKVNSRQQTQRLLCKIFTSSPYPLPSELIMSLYLVP